MRQYFIDASIFLSLLLNDENADKAEALLSNIEASKDLGVVTPPILEEIVFKLIFAKVAEILNTRSIRDIRENLKKNEPLKRQCYETLLKFTEYITTLHKRGLRIEEIYFEDWLNSTKYFHKYGLLPADCLHLAVMEKLNLKTIATFDENFLTVKEVKVIP